MLIWLSSSVSYGPTVACNFAGNGAVVLIKVLLTSGVLISLTAGIVRDVG